MADTSRFDLTLAGEINLDLILYGLPADLPLEREILATGFETTLGSSSAILAHNLSVLSARVGFQTSLGNDAFGTLALDRLAESGVDLSRVRYSSTAGTGVTILLHHGARRRILTYPGAMAQMGAEDLDMEYLASARHFHLSSLFLQQRLSPDLPRIFAALKAAGLTLSLDTNDDPSGTWGGVLDQLLDHIDLLLPNEDELLRIARTSTTEEALDALTGRVPLIAVKCGGRGAIVQQGSSRILVPPVLVKPIDTIGAGDSFNAGFLFGYIHGEPPTRCAERGNICGALSTLRSGGTEAFRDATLRTEFLAAHGF